jgi:hypothetical protein
MRHDLLLGLIACVAFFAATVYRILAVEVDDVATGGEKPMLVVEFGEGAVVQQVFTFPRDDLQSIAVSIWSDHAVTLDVEFQLRRRDRVSGATEEVIATVARILQQPSGAAWHTFEVAPVSDAKDRTFVAAFRLQGATTVSPPAPLRMSVGLMAWADDAVRSGVLFVGSQRRWGDLAFVARAEPATRVERLVRALDAQLPEQFGPQRASLLVLVAFYGALTLFVSGVAISRTSRLPQDTQLAVNAAPSRFTSIGGVFLLAGALALGFGLFAARERVAVDLLRNIDTVAMESPPGRQGVVGLLEESINGVLSKAIFAHPPIRLTWRVAVPTGRSVLRTAVALRPYVWEGRSDGVIFNIAIEDGTSTVAAYSKLVDPAHRFEDRAWITVEVDLSSYAGRSVSVTLETTPGPSGDSSFDWAMWAHPRIISGS